MKNYSILIKICKNVIFLYLSVYILYTYITYINQNTWYIFLLCIYCIIIFIQKIPSELDTIFGQQKRGLERINHLSERKRKILF